MNTTSKFKVFRSYAIPAKGWIVYQGILQSGSVEPGMFLNLGLNTTTAVTLRIHEVLKVTEVDKDEDQLWLIHFCEEDLEMDLIMGMRVFDEEVEISTDGED